MQIKLPVDAVGMTARECPALECSPGTFKIKYGTGLSDEQPHAYCPYCRYRTEPNEFTTKAQLRYAKDIALDEASKGVERTLANALGLGPSGKRKIGGGMFSIEMSMKPTRRPPVRRPWEEQLRRDVICPNCTLAHAVYGLAVRCPDCGSDIFVTHVETESQVIRAMLQDVERRRKELGPRVAARDIENGLEDVVSILETSLRAMIRRKLLADGVSQADADALITKKIRNRCQSYEGAAEVFLQQFSLAIATSLDTATTDRLRATLEKRHPITHNLGIVDRMYLDKVRSQDSEGWDVNLDEDQILAALDSVLVLVKFVHRRLFPVRSPAAVCPG